VGSEQRGETREKGIVTSNNEGKERAIVSKSNIKNVYGGMTVADGALAFTHKAPQL